MNLGLTPNMKKNCVIYVRVSSEKQVDGYSLDSQEDLCRKRAEQLGYDVVSVFREEGVSAKTTKRPELQQMLSFSLSKVNDISAIFVYSLSRLNRNTENHLALRGLLSRAGVDLISYSEPTGSNPVDTFLETIFAATAQMENETRAQNVANSLRRRFFEGNITSKPPFGYLMLKVNGKSIAVKDPDSFDVMQSMWSKVAYEGWSLNDVAHHLNQFGIKSKNNRLFKRFTPKALTQIFANKFYMGVLVSKKYGETTGKHEPMVSDVIFQRVRDVLSGRQPKRTHYNSLREDFKLRKILHCEVCNKTMTSSWSKGRKDKVPVYYCQSRGVHKIYSYNSDKLEKDFIELLKTITYDKDWLTWYTELIKEKYHSQYDELTHTSRLIDQDIAELEAAKKIARQKNMKGVYTDEEYLEMKNEFDAEIVTKKGILAEKKMMELDIDIILEFIVYYLSNLDRAWLDASPEGRVAIGGSIFPDGVQWDGKEFRTARLGLGYEATRKAKNTPILLGEPVIPNFEPLLASYLSIYQELTRYVPSFSTSNIR